MLQKLPLAEQNSNERLEFLGDAILGSVVAEYMYLQHPQVPEGVLSKLRSKVVNRQTLGEIARESGLCTLIRADVGVLDSSGSVAGNALEALIGALYLDLGYIETRKRVLAFLNRYVRLHELDEVAIDYKSSLLERAQKDRVQLHFKHELVREGNDSRFVAIVEWNGRRLAEGEGSSKKRAEQQASAKALQKLKAQGV